jgi:hypothetical protein
MAGFLPHALRFCPETALQLVVHGKNKAGRWLLAHLQLQLHKQWEQDALHALKRAVLYCLCCAPAG